MELPKENPVFRLEEQYEAAAWGSTVASLATLWTQESFHSRLRDVPYSIKAIAREAFKDPSQIVPFLKRRSLGSDPTELKTIGMLVPTNKRATEIYTPFRPSATLMLWHDLLYDRDPTLNDIAEEAGFGRFQDDISKLALYNQARLQATIYDRDCTAEKITDAIGRAHHDNVFYIGKWDNDRSLGIGS